MVIDEEEIIFEQMYIKFYFHYNLTYQRMVISVCCYRSLLCVCIYTVSLLRWFLPYCQPFAAHFKTAVGVEVLKDPFLLTHYC